MGGLPPVPPSPGVPGMKRGGRVKKAEGGGIKKTPFPEGVKVLKPQPPNSPAMDKLMGGIKSDLERATPKKHGGRVKMTGGAEGGLGRIEKAKNAKAARGG